MKLKYFPWSPPLLLNALRRYIEECRFVEALAQGLKTHVLDANQKPCPNQDSDTDGSVHRPRFNSPLYCYGLFHTSFLTIVLCHNEFDESSLGKLSGGSKPIRNIRRRILDVLESGLVTLLLKTGPLSYMDSFVAWSFAPAK